MDGAKNLSLESYLLVPWRTSHCGYSHETVNQSPATVTNGDESVLVMSSLTSVMFDLRIGTEPAATSGGKCRISHSAT